MKPRRTAAPDGYTVLFTNYSGMAINLISFKQLPYDPTRDFAAVVAGVQSRASNAVGECRPAGQVHERIDRLRQGQSRQAFHRFRQYGRRRRLRRQSCSTSAPDSASIEVPYRSAAQLTQDVASGVNQVMMSFDRRLRLRSCSPAKFGRLAICPNSAFRACRTCRRCTTPCPALAMNGFFAIVAPAGTPPDVIAKLNHDIDQYLAAAEHSGTASCVRSRHRAAAARRKALRRPFAPSRISGEAVGKELNVEPQ